MKLTKAQRDAEKWFRDHNGDGMFDKHGVLLAGGELAPFMRSTWNALRDAGVIEFYDKKRVRVIGAAHGRDCAPIVEK